MASRLNVNTSVWGLSIHHTMGPAKRSAAGSSPVRHRTKPNATASSTRFVAAKARLGWSPVAQVSQ